MAFCNKHGIPHSVFLSWDPDDQDKALGFERELNKVCTGCGTRKEEWEEDRFAYVIDHYRCPGCELKEQAQEAMPEKIKGLKTFLLPRKVYEARQRAQELEAQGV